MIAATNSVLHDNFALREASRLYNIPFETLRRHVNGSVEPRCKPGPGTILTEEEEDQLVHYLLRMSEMEFGLSHDTVMCLAYKIVEKSHESIHLKMKRQVRHGSMDSGGIIQGPQSAHFNHYHNMLEHCVQTRIQSMIFLENSLMANNAFKRHKRFHLLEKAQFSQEKVQTCENHRICRADFGEKSTFSAPPTLKCTHGGAPLQQGSKGRRPPPPPQHLYGFCVGLDCTNL